MVNGFVSETMYVDDAKDVCWKMQKIIFLEDGASKCVENKVMGPRRLPNMWTTVQFKYCAARE